MKLYRGIVKGGAVELKDAEGVRDGDGAWVVLDEAASCNGARARERQLRFLSEGFEMGKILAAKRDDLYDV